MRGLIAFHREDGIYVIRPDGSGLRRVVSRGAEPDWSPDGRRIVFEIGNQRRIATARADGSAFRYLTPRRRGVGLYEGDRYPSFSPDGKRIVFCRDDAELVVMNASGKRLRSIKDAQASGTDWQPLPHRLDRAEVLSHLFGPSRP